MPLFAPVMAVGIVAQALRQQGPLRPAGDVLAVVAGVLYLVTFGVGVRERRFDEPARVTFVAATAVLAALAHAHVLAGVAVAAWLVSVAAGDLLPRGRAPASGSILLVAVACQAAARSAALLVMPLAVVAFAAGVAVYVTRLPAVVRDMARARTMNGRGDDWTAAGAAAITCLAAARVAPAVAPACWAVAAGWAVVLLVLELRSGRPRYGPDRWATVFPLGMLSVSAAAAGPHATAVVARPLAVVAALALAATTAGAVSLEGRRVLRPQRRREDGAT